MKKTRLLIADTDKAYLNALVRYLIGAGGQYEVCGYTEVKDFLNEENDFTVALLGDEFITALETNPVKKKQFTSILHLTGMATTEDENYEVIYKFQKMSHFIEKLHQSFSTKKTHREFQNSNYSQRIEVIYSPMHHELTLPFSLSMAKLSGENAQTLFIDMEGVSTLPQMLEREIKRDLGDYLYHIIGNSGDGKNMTDFLGFYENFYYLAPMKGLTALASVSVDQWMCLLENLSYTDFEQIIILMDQMVQGADALLQAADNILLLGKPGSYYENSMKVFTAEMEKEGLIRKCRQFLLPMSVSQQPGEYQIRAMLNGNLGGFVRKEFVNAARAF